MPVKTTKLPILAATDELHQTTFVPSSNIISSASILAHRSITGRSKTVFNQQKANIKQLIGSTVIIYSNDDRSHSNETDITSTLPHTTTIAPAA